jgi:RecB family exonuclease
MPGLTYASTHDAAVLDAARCASIDDMIRALPADAVVLVPTYAHQRAWTSQWARTSTGGSPPVFTTYDQFVASLCQAHDGLAAPHVSHGDAALVADVLARQRGTRLSALGCTFSDIQRWRRANAQVGPNSAPTDIQMAARLQAIAGCVEALQEARHLAVDGVTALRYCLQSLVATVKNGHAVTFRVRDREHAVRSVLIVGHHALPALDRSLWTLLVASGWSVVIRWAGTAQDDDDDHNESIQQLVTTAGDIWQHEAGSSVPLPRVHCIRVANERHRDAAILGTIKEACLHGGLQPSEIVVIPAGDDGTAVMLDERAALAGIPVTASDRMPLGRSALAAALLVACDVVAAQWRRSDVERLAATGICATTVLHLDDLLDCARRYRIRGGYGPSDWDRRLMAQRRLLAAGYGTDAADDVSRIDRARIALKALVAICGTARDSWTASEAATELADGLLMRLGGERLARSQYRQAEATGRPATAMEAYRAVREAIVRYGTIVGSVDQRALPMADHVRAIRALVESCMVRIPDVRIDGVDLCQADDVRDRSWRLVVSPGWTESIVPLERRDDVDAVLAPGDRMRRAQRRLLDTIAAGGLDGHVLLLWPESIDTLDQTPSTLLDWLETKTTVIHNAPPYVACQYPQRVLASTDDREARSSTGSRMRNRTVGFDHAMLSDAARKRLQKRTSRPVSPSRIDLLSTCPYRFGASAIMGLSVENADDDQMTPLERGSVLHETLALFVERLAGGPESFAEHGLRLADHSFDDAYAVLQATANDVLMRMDDDRTFGEAEHRTLFGTPEQAGLLRRWLATALAQSQASDARIVAVELDRDTTVMLGGRPVAVRLRIDRIDEVTTDNGSIFIVYDYKNTKSSVPSVGSVSEGRASQMTFYRAAVLEWAAETNRSVLDVLCEYMPLGNRLRTTEEPVIEHRLGDPLLAESLGFSVKRNHPSAQDQLAVAESGILEAIDMLSAPIWSVSPATAQACTYCPYDALCRINELGASASTQH